VTAGRTAASTAGTVLAFRNAPTGALLCGFAPSTFGLDVRKMRGL
jgi:hypothetical protein